MILLFYALLLFSSQTGENLIKTEVAEGITMAVPETFRPMTDDEIANKYFTTKKPLALFTNMEVTIDLGINNAVTTWDATDLEIMMSFQKSNIYNLYDDINMLDEGTKEIHGKQFAYLEFVSLVKADKDAIVKKSAISKYTFIQYVIIGGNSLVFNFTCPLRLKDKWQPTVHEIMDSIIIKKIRP